MALPLPILVICELLGVPYSDRDQFRSWTEDAANVCDQARSEQGLAELYGYGIELVKHKRAHPDDDVTSRLCATDGVSDEEAAASSMHLLFAGHETTVVQIGWDALLLLTNRGQWQALSDDPALIPNAVEELLRASTRGGAGIAGIPRYARTDFEIDDVAIRAGDLLLLDIGSAITIRRCLSIRIPWTLSVNTPLTDVRIRGTLLHRRSPGAHRAENSLHPIDSTIPSMQLTVDRTTLHRAS